MPEWVCINGRLVEPAEACVSVFDSGFTQGIGLFETMRTYAGKVFRLDEHLQRLITSARQLGWATLPDLDDLITNVDEVVAAANEDVLRVRLTVTTGAARLSAGDEPRLTIVATATDGASYPREMYDQGVTVIASEYRQNRFDATTGHKTTSYFSRMASLREAHAQGAVEALWFTDNMRLAEGAISNVFIYAGEELLTPPLNTPVLPGIARAAILEIAPHLGLRPAERELTIDDLLNAEEVILTNSLMEVMPVVRVEREPIGTGRPGPIARQLREAYRALVQQEIHHGPDEVDEADEEDDGFAL